MSQDPINQSERLVTSEHPPNPDAVGNTHVGEPTRVTPELILQYAQATQDLNPLYAPGPEQIASPLFVVRPLIDELFAAIHDPDLHADVLRLVHGEQELHFLRPLKPGDEVTASSTISEVLEKSSGYVVRIAQELRCGEEVVTKGLSTMFIRSKQPKPRAASSAAAPPEASALPEAYFSEVQATTPDQSHRYAAISNDRNPIHLDTQVAQRAGLPDVILQGLCTLAIATKAVVNGPCKGDSRLLATIKTRFARPVFNADVLTTSVYTSESPLTFAVEMRNQEDRVVLSHALATLRNTVQ